MSIIMLTAVFAEFAKELIIAIFMAVVIVAGVIGGIALRKLLNKRKGSVEQSE
ncbi:MAG: hypothetical protein J5825_09210 [Lachnospiraceae bacterium]|nr:hypothetical protein [Lachnospiraceae bacterium]